MRENEKKESEVNWSWRENLAMEMESVCVCLIAERESNYFGPLNEVGPGSLSTV